MTFLSKPAIARVVPFAIYMCFLVVSDVLTRFWGEAGELKYLYVVKVTCVLGALLYYRKQYTELGNWSLSLSQVGVAILTGIVVFVIWINLHQNWMLMGRPSGFDPRDGGMMDWPLAIARIAGAALVVPVMEELFWRSFLMRWIHDQKFLELDPAQVKITAFVVVVILFGIEHQLWFAGIVAGAVYGGLYVLSRNLALPVLSHAVTNGLLGAWVLATEQWIYW